MVNMFIEHVRDSKRFSLLNMGKYFTHKLKLRKFFKTLDEGSPSFGVLWSFSEFIQYAEVVYSFPNDRDGVLYSSRSYSPGESGFKISRDDMSITVKLWSDTNKVGIDIQNKEGSKFKSSYTFIRQSWTEDPDEYDILLIDRVIDVINKNMIQLTKWCIDKKFADKQYIPNLPKV